MRLERPLRREEMIRILIADDQRDVLEALRILLKGEGYQTEAATSLAGIFNSLEKKEYALLLMDLNYTRDTTSGQEGLSAIPKIRQIDNTLPIVVMTAWATVELAVEAMKRGARDFVTKPWDNQRLLAIVRTQIELASALRRERKLEAENEILRGTMPGFDRGVSCDAACHRNDFTRRAVRCQHSNHRRKRHWEKPDRPGDPCPFAASIACDDHRKYGGLVRDAF